MPETTTTKAANWSAGGGSTITGNLGRATNGQFAAAGSVDPKTEVRNANRQRRAADSAVKRQERAAASAAKRAQRQAQRRQQQAQRQQARSATQAQRQGQRDQAAAQRNQERESRRRASEAARNDRIGASGEARNARISQQAARAQQRANQRAQAQRDRVAQQRANRAKRDAARSQRQDERSRGDASNAAIRQADQARRAAQQAQRDAVRNQTKRDRDASRMQQRAQRVADRASARAANQAQRDAYANQVAADRARTRQQQEAQRTADRNAKRTAQGAASAARHQSSRERAAARDRAAAARQAQQAQRQGQRGEAAARRGLEQRQRQQAAAGAREARQQASYARIRAQRDAAAARFVRQAHKTFAVFKDAAGHDRWLAISSTAYRDRDGEIVSTQALARAVAKADATGLRGPLRFWHVPGMDIGDCDYQALAQDGRFLIESGTFRSPDYAEAFKARGADYQVSIGFLHPASEPDAAGVFDDMTIFERSVVPPGRAANPLTRFTLQEPAMTLPADKLTALKALLGGDTPALQALLGAVATTDKAAQDGGVAYKADDAPTVYTGPDGQPGIIQDGCFVALKAAKPMPPEMDAEMKAPPAAMADPGADPMAEDPGAEEADADAGYAVGDMTAEEFGAMLLPLIAQALAPLLKTLDIETKMRGHMDELKGMYATKEAGLTTEVAALRQQIATLLGDQPAVTAPAASSEALAALKSAGPQASAPTDAWGSIFERVAGGAGSPADAASLIGRR